MPVSIQEMVVSSADALNDSTRLLTAESSITAIMSRSSIADVTAGWKGSRKQSIAIHGIKLRCLGTTTFDMIDPSSQRMCHRVEWMPDVHFLGKRSWELMDFLRLYTFKLPRSRIAIVSQKCEQLSSIVDALQSCSVPNFDVTDVITTSLPTVHTENSGLDQLGLRYHNIIDEVAIDDRELDHKHVAFDFIICDESASPSMLDMTCKFLTSVGKVLVPTTCSLKLSQALGDTFGQGLPLMAAGTDERNKEDANVRPQKSGSPADDLPSYHVLHRSDTGVTADHDRNHRNSSVQPDQVSQLSINIIDQDPRSKTPSINYLMSHLTQLYATIHYSTWDTLGLPGQCVSIVCDNADNAFLANLTEKHFDLLKGLVENSSTIVWVTNCTTSDAESLSLEGLVVGFARTCRSEYEKLTFVTIHVHDQEKNKAIIGELIVKILTAPTSTELEYIARDGEVLIPRVVPDATVASWMSDKTASPRQETSSGPFHNPGKLTRLTQSYNMVYQFVQEDKNRNLDAGMIRISARAFVTDDKFNSTDLGNKKYLTSVAGEVVAISDDTQKRWNLGDRVIVWTFGSTVIANMVDVPAENVHALGFDTPAIAAAELLFTYAAVHCALVQFGSITEGQNILVDTADLPLANAAVSICREAGARPKIMVPDSQDLNAFKEQRDLEEYILVEPSTSDVVFDFGLTSSGTLCSAEVYNLIRPFGTIIHLEKTSARKGRPDTIQTDPTVTHMFLNLPALCQHKPDQINASMRAASCRLAASRAAPFPLIRESIAVGDLVDMLSKSRIHERNNLLYVDCAKNLPVGYISSNSTTPAHSDFNGIYIVAGGFGDLGQMICHLLAKLGAKHILVLSRRGASARAYKKLEREVHKSNPGSHVWSEKCDIGDLRDVEELTKRYTTSLGLRVRGIVHSAVVMKDRTLANMTLNEFNLPLKSKLNGTISLAAMASKFKLDYFIALSSYVGLVGGRGQANYAAGNTYQNSVAQAQSKAGTRFYSLDLPITVDSDYFISDANGPIRLQNIIRQGSKPINKATISAFIEYFITMGSDDVASSHAAFGFDVQSFSEASSLTPSATSMMFSHLHAGARAPSERNMNQSFTVLEQLQSATPRNKEEIVRNATAHQLEQLLGLKEHSINGDQRMSDLGLDSLLAIELKNWVAKSLRATLQVSEILDSRDVDSLVHAITKCLETSSQT